MEHVAKVEIKDIPNCTDVKLIKIIGELDITNADAVRRAIEQCMDGGFSKLLFDLSELKFIDSSGNLSLINAHVRARRQGGDVKLCRVNQNVKELFNVIGVAKLIPIYDSYADALFSFQKEEGT
ncbi:MAG: STAS domain-containing protein [Candidatus Omnitrophica bacterium]|jgi:anti-anti-sigma factor|nr:STAS domain-containing protein [Candidatus Omnitrophota bacterium]MDD5654719.1 STAS domain-containing protein [Candidatus Omnitrophota bacterium]